jgi:N4-gp56 family major capsid protein
MPIITTTGLGDSVRAQYETDYVEGAVKERVYDQLASPISSDMVEKSKTGSTISVPFISKLKPSTQTMSQTEDLTTDSFVDTTATLTTTSRGNAVKWSEAVELFTYTNNVASYISNLGENMMESVDLLAQAAALTGSLVKNAAARASLDAGTATHRLNRSTFIYADSVLNAMRVPSVMTPRGTRRIALFHPWALADLAQDSNILAVGQYQDAGLIMNGEIGELWGWKIVAHPDAKVFYGAGADNATNIATTLAAATEELATSFTVASATNIAAGMRLNIGTEETAGTHYGTNESVIVASVDSTTINIIGMGENGGMRYPHASGVAVRNADSVVPVVFGGPESLAKAYSPSVGEYGQIIGPKKTGLADQWTTMSWKWYGGYGIIAGNRILRSEVSVSLDA